ncbi:MAG: Gfo/Idh/MocA family oxidoreductase [Spirochaetes bacterium]|nr:Gfo/Idh/MocA family oxidoreductase [Spirochaetota bacterium]
MKPIRIGIVGSKFAAAFHTEVWQMLSGAKVVAIAARNPEQRDSFQKKYGIPKAYTLLQELLADPEVDVVDICLPNYLHAETAIKTMEAGKDVICEKPFATTLAEGEKVVEVQKKTGRRFFYAEDWIFAPALLRAEQILKEGGIGKPFYFKGKETHNGSHSPYARTIQYCGGGAMIHLGVHAIGYFYHLLGLPEKVVGLCNGGGQNNYMHTQIEGEDWSAAFLLYKDGTRALVEGNYITRGGMEDVVEVYGSEGRIRVDLTFGSPLSVFSLKGISYAVEKAEFTQGWTKPAIDEYESLGYKRELAHFLACLKGEETQARGTTAEAGFDVLRIIDAIYRSNREERTLVL